MSHNNKQKRRAGGPRAARAASWCAMLLAGLLLTLGACTTPGDIGVGLPDANANTGAYLIDTLTIKASTVLRDSVVTSTSANLLVGQYQDPELGTIRAQSYFSLNLGSAFQPDQTQVFDSAVLVLKPTAFRYGDTTKTQTLVEVHALSPTTPISATKYSFASPRLTAAIPLPEVLNQSRQAGAGGSKPLVAPVLRARRNLATLRLPLSDAWGQALLQAGKNGQLATQDQLDARYPGLALLPGASDNAALLAFGVATGGAALTLYYHDPATPGTVLSHDFTLNGGRHFYQVTADRSTGAALALRSLTSLQPLDAAQTAQRTYIEGALGLVTKLEFPYLTDVSRFSEHLIVTNATITAEVPASTVSGILPPPTDLAIYLTDQNNHLVSRYPVGTANNTATYNPNTASNTGIPRDTYSWTVQQYCQEVINRTIPNTGMLVVSNSPESPARVVLGGPRNAANKLQLRLYFVGN